MPPVPTLLEATHALATPATMTTAWVMTVLLVLTSMNVQSGLTTVSKTTTSQSPLAPTLEAHSVVPVLVPQPVMELPVSTSMTVQLTMAVAWQAMVHVPMDGPQLYALVTVDTAEMVQ